MKRKLNLKLGAVLILVWVITTTLAIGLRLPWGAAKAALACCAGIWAVHVASVVLSNRRV